MVVLLYLILCLPEDSRCGYYDCVVVSWSVEYVCYFAVIVLVFH